MSDFMVQKVQQNQLIIKYNAIYLNSNVNVEILSLSLSIYIYMHTTRSALTEYNQKKLSM